MYCSQCQGIEELFSQEFVGKELDRYRRQGPARTTRMLVEAIQNAGVEGLSLLDIGGGLGAIPHLLLPAGAREATSVDASRAYLEAAKREAQRRGLSDQVTFQHGNFVELADGIDPADVVTLDRVICCYHDMQQLVRLSAERASKVFALVYPRDNWWIRAGLAIGNVYFRLRGSAYRAFSHSTKAVDSIIQSCGLRQRSHFQTLVWQVVVYTR